MGKDEAGTLAALKALRTEVIDPKVAEYSGRVFKSTGDGCLAEFPSVVNAVACATNIQREMAERNPNKPQGNAIQLRIGINVGDIVVDDGDVFGDGVNVAARVESIAPPGGIALTETAREHLGTKLKLDFTDTGTHSLKNIERPVRVFTIGREGDCDPTACEHEWRSGTAVFQRWHYRGHYHRTIAISLLARHRSQFFFSVSNSN
jgi:adenylate cyclase